MSAISPGPYILASRDRDMQRAQESTSITSRASGVSRAYRALTISSSAVLPSSTTSSTRVQTEPDFGQLPGGDEPIEVGRKVGGALRGGDQPRGAGLQEVQQDPGALLVEGPGVVHQDHAFASRAVVADQRGDSVQDRRRRTKRALREAGEGERQASVGGGCT